MSGLSISPLERPVGRVTPTTVSYDVRHVSGDIEPNSARKEPIHKNFRTPLWETEREIHDLLTWPEGWNGYGAAKPNPVSIAHARSWVEQLYRDVRAELWLKPHVIVDADGDIVFEWWKGAKKLTVYVSPGTVEYVKVWGPDILRDMADGEVSDRMALWHWLMD